MHADILTAAPDDTATFCELSDPSADSSPAAWDEQQLILKYLGLVQIAVARVKRRVPRHVSADDLYSMGVSGLMYAVRKFDPANIATFARFASIRIRGAMLDGMRQTDSCTRFTRDRARELEAATNAVEQKLGRAATPAEICSSLGLSREDYEKWVQDARPVKIVALDSEVEHEGSSSSLHQTLADANGETGREQLEKSELADLLTQHIARLPEIPRKVLAMYYFENLRFGTIAEAIGLTESRISQIHRSTIENLRKWFRRTCER